MNVADHSKDVDRILDRFQSRGLTLIPDEGDEIDLTFQAVDDAAEHLKHDTEAIPERCRAAVEFQLCEVCPMAGTEAAMCHALPAILPFLQAFNLRHSHYDVKAVYVDHGHGGEKRVIHISATSLQRALQFVAMQSVLTFCETGKRYRRFFKGIIPFAAAEEMAEKIYANVMLQEKGDATAIRKTIQEMRDTLSITMQCQVKRLRLVSQSDAFANAFVNLHLALQMLDLDTIAALRESGA